VPYDGRESFTGSYLSVGWNKSQLDVGYKPHWLSPLTDSSMLMSTEAPTMPSVSLSNYEPKVARRHVLPDDPHTARPDSFYDIMGGMLTLTYHF
jgi:hypothetical protein